MISLLYILAISLGLLMLISRLSPPHLKPMISHREIAALVYLPIVATIAPNYLILCLSIIAFAAMMPATPQQRARFMMFCLPLLPPFASTVVAPPPLNQLTSIDYNTVFMLGCVSLIFAFRRTTPARFGRWDLLLLLLGSALLIGLVKGTSFTNVLRVSLQLWLFVGLPYLIISRAASVVRSPVELLVPLIFAASIVGAMTVFESQRQWLLYEPMEYRLGVANEVSSYVRTRGGYLRAKATFMDATSLSLFLALATLLLCALREKFPRGLFWLLLSLLLLGQLLTLARIGLVTIFVGLAALLWFNRRFAILSAMLVAGPVAWGVARLAANFSPTLAAAFGFSTDAAFSVNYRSQLANRMLEEIAREPFFGLTQAEIELRLGDMRQGEGIIDLVNTPLAVGLQSGFVGLAMFLAPTAVALWALLRLRRSSDRERVLTAGALFAALLALHAGLLTTSLLARNQLWMVMLLAISAGLCARRAAGVTSQKANLVESPA